jgi:hypothetical protein
MNDNISILPTVAVITGAPALPYLTPVKVAVVAVPAAGCLSSMTNDLPAVAVGIVKVQGVDDVRVAVWTVPEVRDIVLALVTVPIATTLSI